jgi:glycosyltransferase involved in cell wall biosynthesis
MDPHRCHVVYNGFDDDDFKNLPAKQATAGKVRLLHAGTLDFRYRNPLPFLEAIARLRHRPPLSQKGVSVEFLAPGANFENERFRNRLLEHSLVDVVTVTPGVPYKDSLQKQGDADILLLFQNHSAINMQIPAKLFEYMRIGKPVLAIAPQNSETARVVRDSRCGTVVDSENEEDFVESLYSGLETILLRTTSSGFDQVQNLSEYSRRYQTKKLAGILENVVTRL